MKRPIAIGRAAPARDATQPQKAVSCPSWVPGSYQHRVPLHVQQSLAEVIGRRHTSSDARHALRTLPEPLRDASKAGGREAARQASRNTLAQAPTEPTEP